MFPAQFIPLTLVHIHPNNYGGVDNNHDPLAVEMTFAKDAIPIDNMPYQLPHKPDNSNTHNYPDIKITR